MKLFQKIKQFKLHYFKITKRFIIYINKSDLYSYLIIPTIGLKYHNNSTRFVNSIKHTSKSIYVELIFLNIKCGLDIFFDFSKPLTREIIEKLGFEYQFTNNNIDTYYYYYKDNVYQLTLSDEYSKLICKGSIKEKNITIYKGIIDNEWLLKRIISKL